VLTLAPDLETLTFKGHVQIEVDVRKSSDTIRLNTVELAFDEIKISDASGREMSGTASFDGKTEITSLHFPAAVKGACTLSLKYNGKVRQDGTGLFVATWKDKNGDEEVEHKMLASQFEGCYARRAFPCFDQPDMKATFKVFLVVDKELKALSNGDAVGIATYDGELGQGKKIVEFAETMKMSTYLAAFVVGPLVPTSPQIINGVRITIWLVPGRTSAGAMEAACYALDYYEKYFGVRYPGGTKLDLIGVPGFAWGGMENVGCIIFQEHCLTIADPEGKNADLSHTYAVIFHEIAHQWFGDLVTMEWWDGLWLNESFATLMGWKGVAAWRPQFNVWDSFGYGRESAYSIDSMINSHPIQVGVLNPHDHEQMVDPISYEKGCSVLYQFEQYVGEELFRRGISHYLKRHSFGNTVASDLWDSLEAVCNNPGDCRECNQGCLGLPVRKLMDRWIKMVGYPELIVDGSLKTGRFELRQRPFRLLSKGRSRRQCWPLLVTYKYATSDGETHTAKFVFDEKQTTLQLPEKLEWLKFNAGGTGFYRVRYSDDLRAALLDHMEELSVIERYNLASDAAAQTAAAIMPAEQFLELALSFMHEEDSAVWGAVGKGLERVARWTPAAHKPNMRKHVAKALGCAAAVHGWGTDAKSMPLSKDWLPYHLNLNPVIHEASRKVFEHWQRDPDSLDAKTVARAAMILHFAKAEVPDEFRDLQEQAKDYTAEELQRYVITLSQLAEKGSDAANPFYLIASILLDERVEQEATVQTFIDGWAKMRAEKSPHHIAMRVRGLSNFADAACEKQLQKLFKAEPYPLAQWAIDQTLERIRANVVARRKQSRRLARYLSEPDAERS
jgi:puromycin-sensitive aminopeptidase